MKAGRIISIFADIGAVALFIYLLIFPQYAATPTRLALEFCAGTLIPSLFIYMVLAKTVISLPIMDKLTKRIGLEPIALMIGTLCGCPIGAKNAVSLYDSGRISKKHAEYLCSFTNNASVSFVIGFAGGELFGDMALGMRLFIYQLTASVIAATVMKFVIFGKEKLPKAVFMGGGKVGIRESVADSAETMLNLCACAVFFIVAGSACTRIFSLDTTADAILKSILEFSSGCAAAAKTGKFAVPITAFAIGHTGCSVALQVKSVVSNKLSIRPFLLGKLISCAVMTALAIIFG